MEYLGRDDSGKPRNYAYSAIERADLVEALWAAHDVISTLAVSFGYSSLVVLELLARRLDRSAAGDPEGTRTSGVLLVNGGLFADARSHPWRITPVHEDPARRPGHGLKPGPPGVRFLHDGAGFVDEHNRNAAGWDLARLTAALGNELTWDLAGSALDPYEPRPIRAASQRLDPTLVRIHDLPGPTTGEHLNLLADLIHALPRPRLTRPPGGSPPQPISTEGNHPS